MGHSIGGAIAAKVAKHILEGKSGDEKLKKVISGLIIIDSLESIALECLPMMVELLK